MLEMTLNDATRNFEMNFAHFEKLIKDAQKAVEESKDLVKQGREKASMGATIHKLEEELSRSHLIIDDLQFKEKTLTEKLNKSRGEYDFNLKRLKSEYENLHKQHTALKGAYDELHTLHYSASATVIYK